ncbi:glycosyltransferase [Winogradskyella alexanderae]|uniref:Family 2 glycosyl transferase n=1 Tax=Winogradskyella alexanderae TaxID=2877123 RepID=A0ABS7XU99_9FLAO|nr:glycosyltransferase [Winogradskyella alexanderae]MCA0132591.1 family 2 glycosyl transferase [Winogradskyella alexanderae]
MKLGIIIVFNNNQDDIKTKTIIDQLKSTDQIEFCLVDNESKDDTLELLREIKENCSSVSIVEIKKHVSIVASKRAGARYMFNNFDLRHLACLDVNTLKSYRLNLSDIIELICTETESIISYDRDLKSKYIIKPTLFKSVFSLMDYLKKVQGKEVSRGLNLIIV